MLLPLTADKENVDPNLVNVALRYFWGRPLLDYAATEADVDIEENKANKNWGCCKAQARILCAMTNPGCR